MITLDDLSLILDATGATVLATRIERSPQQGLELHIVVSKDGRDLRICLDANGYMWYRQTDRRYHQFPIGMSPLAIAQELESKLSS